MIIYCVIKSKKSGSLLKEDVRCGDGPVHLFLTFVFKYDIIKIFVDNIIEDVILQ